MVQRGQLAQILLGRVLREKHRDPLIPVEDPPARRVEPSEVIPGDQVDPGEPVEPGVLPRTGDMPSIHAVGGIPGSTSPDADVRAPIGTRCTAGMNNRAGTRSPLCMNQSSAASIRAFHCETGRPSWRTHGERYDTATGSQASAPSAERTHAPYQSVEP